MWLLVKNNLCWSCRCLLWYILDILRIILILHSSCLSQRAPMASPSWGDNNVQIFPQIAFHQISLSGFCHCFTSQRAWFCSDEAIRNAGGVVFNGICGWNNVISSGCFLYRHNKNVITFLHLLAVSVPGLLTLANPDFMQTFCIEVSYEEVHIKMRGICLLLFNDRCSLTCCKKNFR